MTRRHPRDGLRDRWVEAILTSGIGSPCKLLLMLFAHRMNDRGVVDNVTREDIATVLGVHPQRVAERISEAKKAGLLAQIGGGNKHRPARYEAVIHALPVPLSGTGTNNANLSRTVQRYEPSGTSRPGQIDLPVPLSGTHYARAYQDGPRRRHAHQRHARVERDHDQTQRRTEQEVPTGSPLDAGLKSQHEQNSTRRPTARERDVGEARGESVTEPRWKSPEQHDEPEPEPERVGGNPCCRVCGLPRLYSPATIARGICARCIEVLGTENNLVLDTEPTEDDTELDEGNTG